MHMGIFVKIRGWIEVNDAQMPQVRQAVANASELVNAYASAWCFSAGYNGSAFAFFGAAVREQALPDFEHLVRSIGETISVPDEPYVDFPEGVFHIQHEFDHVPAVVWRFADGVFTVEASHA
jgi:hypothetical protein